MIILQIGLITLCNVCSVHQGDTMSTSGGIMMHVGGHHGYIGGCSVHQGDTMSTLGEIMSTLGDVQIPPPFRCTHDIPRCTHGIP